MKFIFTQYLEKPIYVHKIQITVVDVYRFSRNSDLKLLSKLACQALTRRKNLTY